MQFLRRNYLYLLFLLLLPVMFNRIRGNPRSVIWSDSEGYYLYLPGVFIIGDMHKIPEGTVWPQRNAQGEILIKYTCGVAIFEAPFFLVTKWYCQLKNYDWKDYFNVHYCRAMAICGYVFGFVGLFFLQKTLRRRHSEKVVFWTLLATFFGTNLFHYTTREMSISHVYSFCLFAFTAWHLPRFYEKPSWANAAVLGGALGWTILIRPTNALILLFVLLYDVYSWRTLKERARFFLRNLPKLGAAALAAFVFLFPQMLYWHEMTGSWVRYSYTDEKFIYWNKPKILDVLFDVQNGLFLYSPMVLLMVLGIFIGLRERKYHAPALLLIFCLATYIFASWWAWWFGGAFGHRCYVEYYALLALPLAGVFEKIFALRSKLLRWLILAVVVFLMYYGTKMSFLYTWLPGPWDGVDWRWNFEKIKWVWSYLFKW
ncbi:MAG: glycosyltransferase family 39 protein [Saprospiraceae bacterium]|nr:glycosyltransferase family 39 protein [Saprospiraceae bacterium]